MSQTKVTNQSQAAQSRSSPIQKSWCVRNGAVSVMPASWGSKRSPNGAVPAKRRGLKPLVCARKWLVLLGEYARQLGLTAALNAVPLQQKVRAHRPQTKVIEFLVAILAGLPHLEDISRGGYPLDQDSAVALAWQQPD